MLVPVLIYNRDLIKMPLKIMNFIKTDCPIYTKSWERFTGCAMSYFNCIILRCSKSHVWSFSKTGIM